MFTTSLKRLGLGILIGFIVLVGAGIALDSLGLQEFRVQNAGTINGLMIMIGIPIVMGMMFDARWAKTIATMTLGLGVTGIAIWYFALVLRGESWAFPPLSALTGMYICLGTFAGLGIPVVGLRIIIEKTIAQ